MDNQKQKKPKKTKEEQRIYMREWREKNREKVRAVNHRYYERNRGWLNKSRTVPWGEKTIIRRILSGDKAYINIMLRLIRPQKDPFIEKD